MTWEENYLAHFGIKGQKWGVRRYQNEDGSLTPEGRERYLSNLTGEQKRAYNSLGRKDRIRFDKRLAEGKSFDQAAKEVNRIAAAKSMALTGAFLYLNPYTRPLMQISGKLLGAGVKFIGKLGVVGIKKIAQSNIAQKGAQYIQRMMRRRASAKSGAITLNKSQFSVKDPVIPFGGYLGR